MHTDIKDPAAWHRVDTGEVLEFSHTGRTTLTINTTAKTSVWVATNEDMDDAVLLAAGDGMFTVRYSASGPSYVQTQAPEGAITFFKGHTPNQRVPASEDASFTNIAPRGRPTELMRMMYIAKLNERARDATLQAEISRMRAVNAASRVQPAEPAPAPTPEPTPPPEQKKAPAAEPAA